MAVINFHPESTQILSATGTSSSVTFSGVAGSLRQVRIYNAGSVAVFVRFTTTTGTAVVTDMPIAPTSVEVFDLRNHDTVSGITASSTATVYVTVGHGIG